MFKNRTKLGGIDKIFNRFTIFIVVIRETNLIVIQNYILCTTEYSIKLLGKIRNNNKNHKNDLIISKKTFQVNK